MDPKSSRKNDQKMIKKNSKKIEIFRVFDAVVADFEAFQAATVQQRSREQEHERGRERERATEIMRVYLTRRALRVIPRGKHGWRFTARIKFLVNGLEK